MARTGIRARHARKCPANEDRAAKCRCKPRYEAAVQLRGPDAKNRKKLRKTFATESAARAWRIDTLNALGNGTLREPTKKTVRQAADELVAGMKSGAIRTRSGDPYKPSAIRAYERALRLRILDELGGSKLADVQRRDVQRIADTMHADGCDPSTIRNALMPLRVIYRRAIEDGDVAVNPCTSLRLPAVRGKRDRIASPDEAERLIAALPDPLRPLYATACYAGLRRGELQALRWSDVDLGNGRIHVRHSWDEQAGEVEPKSAAGKRTVPIAAVLRDYLDEHRLRTRGDGLVFGLDAERPFAASGVHRRAERAWRKSNAAEAAKAEEQGRDPQPLEPIALHECRHTFASLMIAAGVNAKALSTYLGHSSIQVTFDRYGHLLDGNEDEAAALLDAYLERANTQARLAQVA